jgi:hypothetical protein
MCGTNLKYCAGVCLERMVELYLYQHHHDSKEFVVISLCPMPHCFMYSCKWKIDVY